jgi:short-subunit dehydrogenase
VLVTGASGGLGDAIARACAARGAHVAVTGRREQTLRALADDIGAEVFCADLADEDAVARLADAVGEVDVLVSNAALPAGGTVDTFSVEELSRSIAVNVRAPMVLSRLLTPRMVARRQGHVVFVSSLAAAFPTPGLTVYNATKAALAIYGLSLRGELASHGVGVSVVYPGPISGAGMWAETGLAAPMGLPTRSPGQVGAAVVRAVERNQAEVSVAPVALRVGALLGRATPATFARLAPRLGAHRVTGAMADALRHKR